MRKKTMCQYINPRLHCQRCRGIMKINDIAYKWDGEQTNEYVCTKCGAMAYEYISMRKVIGIDWRY